MRWRAALGVAALLAVAVGFFAVTLLTIHPLPQPLDPISTRVIAAGFRLPAFKRESDFPQTDVLDLLPTSAIETGEFLTSRGFEPLQDFAVYSANAEKLDHSEVSSESNAAPHSLSELPVETTAPRLAPEVFSVPDIALAANGAVRTYYSRAVCHDGTFYIIGLAFDSGHAAQMLQAKAYLMIVGFDMCG